MHTEDFECIMPIVDIAYGHVPVMSKNVGKSWLAGASHQSADEVFHLPIIKDVHRRVAPYLFNVSRGSRAYNQAANTSFAMSTYLRPPSACRDIQTETNGCNDTNSVSYGNLGNAEALCDSFLLKTLLLLGG